MNNKVVKLYESCLITKGSKRSIIIDVQRKKYYFIPNTLVALFDENNTLKTEGIILEDDDHQILSEYVNFLFENELCFYCDKELVENFPKIDIQKWDYPAKITNAIVEIDGTSFDSHFKILEELTNSFLTRYVELHFPEPVDCKYLRDVFSKVDTLDLYNYNVIFRLKDRKELGESIKLLNFHYKIFRSIISDAGKTEIIESDKFGWGNIFLTEDIFSYKNCGIIDKYNFSLNLSHISESIEHNTCLNRKMTIDIDGNIRNCPNTPEIYGNIRDIQLADILTKTNFSEYWKINKDNIETCKDCEFRHICTDCRAFLEDAENIYSKPLKCGYNPYTCEWEEWSNSPLKQKSIQYFGLTESI